MAALPLTSILTPVFNNLAILEHMVASLYNHTPPFPFEIILVDNHSTEAGAEAALERLSQRPNLKLIQNSSNVGFGKANNQALAISQGEILVLMNSDMFVNRPWLGAMLRRLQSEKCGAVQAKILLPQEDRPYADWPVQTVGARFDDQGLPQYQLANVPHQAPEVNQPMRLEAFMGTGVALSRRVVDEVGFFDEAYDLVFLEDSDLSMRVRQAGYQIWYEPGAEMIHLHSASMPHLSQEEYDRSRRGNLALFQKKWPPQLIRQILGQE